MKRILLISALLLVSNSYAFESGTYECKFGNSPFKLVLKDNGRAKMIGKGGTERGYWQDDDDAAIVIKQNQVLEKRGNKFIFNIDNNPFSQLPCKKL